VALDALDARVRARAVGGELGLHHRVAGLAAELDALGVLEGAVAAEGAHEEEDEREQEEGDEGAPPAWVVEVEDGVAPYLVGLHPVTPVALPERADEEDGQPEPHDRGEDDVGEDAGVRVAAVRLAAQELQQEHERDADEAGGRDGRAREADVVAEKRRGLGGRRRARRRARRSRPARGLPLFVLTHREPSVPPARAPGRGRLSERARRPPAG
jgi:hypothetical protein